MQNTYNYTLSWPHTEFGLQSLEVGNNYYSESQKVTYITPSMKKLEHFLLLVEI